VGTRSPIRKPLIHNINFAVCPCTANSGLADGVPPGVILGDAGYGIDTDFRLAVSEPALVYVLGVQSSLGVWPRAAARCRPSHGPARDGHPGCGAGMPSTSR
jgi:SRSO17 transposase